ncbi:hypothetical protein [Deinococcus fonticola]|uniref:hypothetical protein n=1 Tax=Deinococcus fonticola TaxID=2528713 RepID=UPI001074B439|nr:hypothetical protein [Deinococcus fonticola]
MTTKKRLDVLEEARRKWEAEHLPIGEMFSCLNAVLGVVFDEAGPEVGGRIAGRIVGDKARRVDALSRRGQA